MAAGGVHTCARLAGERVKCWGIGLLGSLGSEAADYIGLTDKPADHDPITILAGDEVGVQLVSIQAGKAHTCVHKDNGRVNCWGHNAFGQLGQGSSDIAFGEEAGDSPASRYLAGFGSDPVAIATGDLHSCALLVNGNIRCFGKNDFGQLGTGDTQNLGISPGFTPAVSDGLPGVSVNVAAAAIIEIGLGFAHSCALLDTGSVRCWGDNSYGQFGINSPAPANSRALVPNSVSNADL